MGAAWIVILVSLFAPASAEAAASAARRSFFQWRPFLGPFHSLVLHYPIGFLTMAFILELYALRKPGIDLRPVTRLVIWLSLLTGLASATLGIMRAGGGGYETKAVEIHRLCGMAVPVFTLLTLIVQRVAYREPVRRGAMACYRILLLGTLGLLVAASHYGGNLTHGSKYLTQNAPEFVKTLLEPPAHTTLFVSTNLDESQQFFVEKVRPVLEAKCVRCHGPEKQKGKFRLDQKEFALRGGESGKPAIKPGEPLASELVRLILLPRDHDEAMPPAGKEALSAEEIMNLVHWVQAGAPFVEAETEANTSSVTH
ncbi:MAG: hypothetical protein HY043_01155 [Verrucomicrobia bacterium]|nr:hypothetical protein [Verrucomicrobiota bacterium]